MWDERGLFEHSLRKKETRQIINKIQAKHYLDMRKSHSEGSEVASDYAMQLRHAIRKSKTQKLTFLHKQHLRKRMITQFSQRSRLNSAQLQFNQMPMPDVNVQKIGEDKQLEQEEERGKFVKSTGSNIKIEAQDSFKYEQSNDRQLQLDVRKSEQSSGPPSVQFEQMNKSKKHFLPMLELYIQQLNSLKTMSAHQKSIRNIIVTMMVLAINRRQNGSLLEALDILLQTEIYFPRQNKEMVHLKSVWLSLIGKIYQQINKGFKSDSSKNRWKKTTRKSSFKANLQAKRQKTIFIRSLASRKAFFDKFSQNLRKSKLIYESTYMMELANEQNTLKIQNGHMVISKASSQFMMSFPDPRHVFPDSEDIVNYAIIVISKDNEANIFPFNYPQSLTGFISKHDYMSKIIKINSCLLPMARCMNFSTALSINFEFILSILVILLIATILLMASYSRVTIAVAITVFTIFLLLASSRIHSRVQSRMGLVGQVNQMMQKCCKQWEEDYIQYEIKFLLDHNCDILFISFPIDEDQPEEQSSSNSLYRHESKQKQQKIENQMSRKCSIKLSNPSFINPLDQINEDSSDDNEPNAQFWKQIYARAENDVELELKQQFEEQLSQQSQDEVMRVPQHTVDHLEVELIAVKALFCPDLQ